MTRDRTQPPHDPRDPDADAIPEPGDEATASEKARARAFGDLIERAMAGRGMPAAMSADDRALVEVATVIRGAAGKIELAPSRAASLVDAALLAAVDKDRPRSASMPPIAGADVIPIARAPRRRLLPWGIAAVSTAVAAVAVAVMLLAPAPRRREAPPARMLTETQRSRPADALVGVIARDKAGDAATRIDAIYADRLDGYRELALAGVRPARAHKRGAP